MSHLFFGILCFSTHFTDVTEFDKCILSSLQMVNTIQHSKHNTKAQETCATCVQYRIRNQIEIVLYIQCQKMWMLLPSPCLLPSHKKWRISELNLIDRYEAIHMHQEEYSQKV